MRFLPLLFCWGLIAQAQWPGVEFKPEPGTTALQSRYDHATWASPESIVRDLRSDDDSTRSKALRLFGYPEARMQEEVPRPDGIELRYAAIGDDNTLQAIVALTVNVAMAYVAVAVPEAKGWKRIGAFFCSKLETRSLSGKTLVESREEFEPTAGPPPRNATCTAYEWDEKTFRDRRSGAPTKCAKPTTPP